MLNNGLYIYNSKFSEIITDFEFSKNGITNYNNIILESFKEKYLICFINNKFIIYNADTNSIEDLTYKNYDQKFNNYYNLIPYDFQKQKLVFTIIYEEQYDTCKWLTLCISKNHNYKIVFSFAYFQEEIMIMKIKILMIIVF